MEKMNYKELDNRIHTFLNRKFAELETMERLARTSDKKSWRPERPAPSKMSERLVNA
jgi:hypothetical protein